MQRYQPTSTWARELDRFFERELLGSALPAGPRELFHESADSWILRLDLPGFAKSEVALKVDGRILKLVAETPADRPFGGKIERQWKLGDDVDAGNVTAKLENGVLEIVLPKVPEVNRQPVNVAVN